MQNKQEALLAMGYATRQGIRVPPGNAHHSFTAFEALTGSNYHRPCQFTYAASSISLQASPYSLNNLPCTPTEVLPELTGYAYTNTHIPSLTH